ncbi:Chitinase 3 [Candida parapsilosis]|nr:Chitinase 3 [Candida parapsilosis]
MLSLLYLISIFATAVFAFDPTSNANVAVYWGQNSGGNQQRLSYYCDSDAVDIVILSFMHVFPNPVQLNFANACEGTFTSDGILKCDNIAADIQSCQAKGKIVLLSLGGASGSYGFTSDDQAKKFAHTAWDLFGNSDTLSASERPFGSAILDGFDFDIENHINTGYAAMANELRSIFATDSSKQYYLGAAPQCPYPDASVGNFWFNWDTWLDYAENTSSNANVKLFVGVPGSIRAAGSGYNPPELIEDYLTSDILSSPHFGGISMWDVSAAWDNTDSNGNFVENMKRLVGSDFQAAAVSSSSSSSSSDSTTTTTTTTLTTTSTTYTSDTTTTSTSSTPSTSSTSSSSTLTSSSSSTSSTSQLISSIHNADLTTTGSTTSTSSDTNTQQESTLEVSTATQQSTTRQQSSSSSTSSVPNTSTSTPTNVFTSFVFAPTTMTTVATLYNVITTRTNLQTIYGPPPTTAI